MRLSDDEIARLARVLADSGATLSWPSTVTVADIPSTGGPSSLSTLISPLFLVALGCAVPKLAVIGRPAGGIDVMAQVPYYTITLSRTDVLRIIDRCRYAHFLATTDHAPLDARLFDYRRKTDAVNVPALAIASLLAKKLAVGLAQVGLEVRVAPHGNFGGTWTEARKCGAILHDRTNRGHRCNLFSDRRLQAVSAVRRARRGPNGSRAATRREARTVARTARSHVLRNGKVGSRSRFVEPSRQRPNHPRVRSQLRGPRV